MSNVYVCVYKQTSRQDYVGGSGGMLPQEIFINYMYIKSFGEFEQTPSNPPCLRACCLCNIRSPALKRHNSFFFYMMPYYDHVFATCFITHKRVYYGHCFACIYSCNLSLSIHRWQSCLLAQSDQTKQGHSIPMVMMAIIGYRRLLWPLCVN